MDGQSIMKAETTPRRACPIGAWQASFATSVHQGRLLFRVHEHLHRVALHLRCAEKIKCCHVDEVTQQRQCCKEIKYESELIPRAVFLERVETFWLSTAYNSADWRKSSPGSHQVEVKARQNSYQRSNYRLHTMYDRLKAAKFPGYHPASIPNHSESFPETPQ